MNRAKHFNIKPNQRVSRKVKATLLATTVLAGMSLTSNFSANAASVKSDWVANTTTEIAQNIGDVKAVYTIKKGDTLWGITQALATKGYQTSVDQLAKINNIVNVNLIIAGNTMKFSEVGNNTVVEVQGANGNVKGTYSIGSNKNTNTVRNNTTTANSTSTTTNNTANGNNNNGQNSNNNNQNNNNTPANPNAVNKDVLQSVITQAQSLVTQTDVYTIDSIIKLQAALASGLSKNNDNSATQVDVDNATAAINNAIGGLVKLTDIKKDALQAAITKAQSLVTQTSVYTADSIAGLQKALDNGRSVNSHNAATQNDVDAATTAINDAIAGLVKQDVN
ncbi:LysM peptidoglycan-binding domain-containing protein [Ligilactobacillus sp. WILCCON 0076]|uniref:LysM peptidoglycan-binding domain-containing protein n=1 Tax=Ligilactobacillus ubinensis TaxID=2876789 RepID=A0A9X2JLZ2_9LACO|nr:LysM domain-containing protein [Ligilactobacillus ubinensis]MCP0887130.1 LysM peptidoglycan-binding domain-containing protein [Ligilactobacillus ubinensis]